MVRQMMMMVMMMVAVIVDTAIVKLPISLNVMNTVGKLVENFLNLTCQYLNNSRFLRHVKFILPALAEAESTVLYRPIKYALFPPLGLALLAGYLRKDRDRIEICDLHVEKTDFSDSPDLVAIEVYITNARRAYRIADAYRKRGIFVVLGGLHPTSLPEEALLHAAAAHAEVMPAADQQADDRRECQAGADDLQDHACSFVHNTPPVSVHWPSPLGFVSSYTFRRGLTTVFCAGRKGLRPAAPAAGQRIYGAMIRPFYFSGTSFPCQNPFRLMQDAT